MQILCFSANDKREFFNNLGNTCDKSEWVNNAHGGSREIE